MREIAKLMHMSFRDIGAIIKKVKLQAERERGYTNDEVDTEPKSRECQAFKLFSEGKSPLEVAIALDQPAGCVRAIYREFLELNDMHQLVQAYDQIKDYLPSFLRLHKTLDDLGMGEQEIINVLNLVNSHQLKHLQWKVEYLRNDIEMLEVQKTILNRIINESQEILNNSSNFSQSNTSWYSVDISYTPMNDYWPQQ
jgi:hypothetical protein